MVILSIVIIILIVLIIYDNPFNFLNVCFLIIGSVLMLYLNSLDNKVSIIGGGSKKINYNYAPLLNPRYNIQQCVKQLILLEDHIFHKNKRCRDCISKHYLMIDGLLEEAITLNNGDEFEPLVSDLLNKLRPLMGDFITKLRDGDEDIDYNEVGQSLRELRKSILLKYVVFDPDDNSLL